MANLPLRKAEARYALGFYYARGTGVVANEREAVKWYKLAAKAGNAMAMNNIGLIYYSLVC